MKSRWALALWMITGCVPHAVATSVRLVGAQDAVRLAPTGHIPTGGITDRRRIAAAASVRTDYGSAALDAIAQRTPMVSGGAFLAYGFDTSDLWTSCRFADARLGASPNPALAPQSPHQGMLWRCGAGVRFGVEIMEGVRLVFGGSFAFDNTLVQRTITETETVTFSHIDSTGQWPVTVATRGTVTTTEYLDRRTMLHMIGIAHLGAQYRPTAWLRFDTGIAAGTAPFYPRHVESQWSYVGSGAPSRARDLYLFHTGYFAFGWLGASFGPEFARFALQMQTAGGDGIGNAVFAMEGAMIFSLGHQPLRPAGWRCNDDACRRAARP
ncbi:MAG: hypothetical protein JNK05_12645 [Myxococcales bacterium]|nr:hypothetical protein [Myxococcales bacterium]